MINHPDVSSVWGTWAEQQEAALQHRDRANEHALKALHSPQVATTPVSPCNASLEPPLGSPDTSRTLQPGSGSEIRIQNAAIPRETTQHRKRATTKRKISRSDFSLWRILGPFFPVDRLRKRLCTTRGCFFPGCIHKPYLRYMAIMVRACAVHGGVQKCIGGDLATPASQSSERFNGRRLT
ncbi:unnamed protein product [Sphacelaria rigidula]